MKTIKRTPLRLFVITLVALSSAFSFSHERAYQFFTKNGNKTSFKRLVKKASKADVILFGELHNNPICHWLELELAQAIHAKSDRKLVLGAEMFETDNQAALGHYVRKEIEEDTFEAQCRLWPNYDTDYKPLVEFTRTNGLGFFATNIPRRYARMVYRGGLGSLDTLPDSEKAWITPLPMEYDSSLKCYADIYEMAGGHGGQNLPKAQAIKDATMAHNIMRNCTEGTVFIHYNGTYHSNNYQSIYWYLKKIDPNVNILTIASTEEEDIRKLSEDSKGLADFILAVPSDMTKTY